MFPPPPRAFVVACVVASLLSSSSFLVLPAEATGNGGGIDDGFDGREGGGGGVRRNAGSASPPVADDGRSTAGPKKPTTAEASAVGVGGFVRSRPDAFVAGDDDGADFAATANDPARERRRNGRDLDDLESFNENYVERVRDSTKIVGLDRYDQQDATNRIIGGTNARYNRYLYYCTFLKERCHSFENDVGQIEWQCHNTWNWEGCGGTLIHPRFVLTAAHCVETFTKVGKKGTFIGAYSPFDGSYNSWQRADIKTWSQSFVHPLYNERTHEFDVALIKLDYPSKMPTIRLDDGSVDGAFEGGEKVTVLGFGVTDTKDPRAPPPDVLQEVELRHVTNQQCAASYGPDRITRDMICAADVNRDACQGDSGGPMIVTGKNSKDDVQIGTVAWGKGCAWRDYPGVYERVSVSKSWIDETICVESSDDPEAECWGTSDPSDAPTKTPSDAPSSKPSESPSDGPTDAPAEIPSEAPSGSPSDAPAETPSEAPSVAPSSSPSARPSDVPTEMPSEAPSSVPSDRPATSAPTNGPSVAPARSSVTDHQGARAASAAPTFEPSDAPSEIFSDDPTPGASSTIEPTPSAETTYAPTTSISETIPPTPGSSSTLVPSRTPVAAPTSVPSADPVAATTKTLNEVDVSTLSSLSTGYDADNYANGNMFAINVYRTLTIETFGIHLDVDDETYVDVEIYHKEDSYQTYEADPTSWGLLCKGSVQGGTGYGEETLIPPMLCASLTLEAGTEHSFYVTTATSNVLYRNGNEEGKIVVDNNDMAIREGSGVRGTFGTSFAPRVWNGSIYYRRAEIGEAN